MFNKLLPLADRPVNSVLLRFILFILLSEQRNSVKNVFLVTSKFSNWLFEQSK